MKSAAASAGATPEARANAATDGVNCGETAIGRSNLSSRRSNGFLGVAAMACGLLVIAATMANKDGNEIGSWFGVARVASNGKSHNNNNNNNRNESQRRRMSGAERLMATEPEPEGDTTKEDALVAKIAKKLDPVPLRFFAPGDPNRGESSEPDIVWVDSKETRDIETIKAEKKKEEDLKPKLVPHQFLHLHHMKTGGTSMDKVMRCAMKRLREEANYSVPYYSIHECSRERFASCLTDPGNKCRAKMDEAAVMSYCSALKYLDEFGWWHEGNQEHTVKAFTVLRHPVDRVWSMFRFQTKRCYGCTPLKEIYKKLEKGEHTGVDKLCRDQLLNHEVNNLLSSEYRVEVAELDVENNRKHGEIRDKMVQEAIDNMKGFFTVIGITEELEETSAVLGRVFPWMNASGSEADGTVSECNLGHDNASPRNNRCGEHNSHWDLPATPDQETIDLIVKHNSLDMELYEAAVKYFDLQKRALESIADEINQNENENENENEDEDEDEIENENETETETESESENENENENGGE